MSQLFFVVVGDKMPRFQVRQAASLQGVAVEGLIRDAVAEYTMIQTYVNPLRKKYIEAAYVFPLYEGVAVAGFQAEVDGRKIVGKVREKVAAMEEYQEAVSAGKTASLLEQEKPDVFQAFIGNVPPGKAISIRITLVSEIKQDAGENEVRFVLPTTVAPRYGCSNNYGGVLGNSNSPNFKLSVKMACAMSKPITSVQSPSHPIDVHVGTTEILSSSESFAFDPNRARVSLTGVSLLDRDLIIIVQSLGLDQPRVLVERHPTDETHAISLTFQPRFALQPLRASELVFLIDRSGSMSGPQIRRAGEALELFLRSIPFENHYFNIIGFGSTHQALFPISVEYNAESLRAGVQYAQTIQANMGGTEIASAFQEVFQRRRRDVPTQIFLLTDGQIWNVEQLGRDISNAVDDGERSNQRVRVFSLGVGDSVSHHLIESVARAGGGYAQLVMAGERMEKKVVNMLKAGLTPPVTNTAIEWTDSIDDNFVMVEGEEGADDGLALVNKNASKPLIDLFSKSPPVVSENSPPPEISATIHQAPFKIPVLCRGARFTVYAILSPTIPLPKELVLRGVSADGPVELRVKIESVTEGETMLHSLAARALVRDLEEASSPIHALGKALTVYEEQKLKHLGVSVAQREGQKRSDILPLSFNHVAEITKQKMVDIGVKYSLSTKYTSWVAIDEEGPRKAQDAISEGSYFVNVAPSAPQVSVCSGGPLNRHSIAFPPAACFRGQTFSLAAPQALSSGGFFAQQAASSTNDIPFGGQTASGLFGTCTPAFGAQCQPSFSGNSFMASSAPAFSAAPGFGAGSSFRDTPASAFGAAPAFGAGSPFRDTPAPAFGAGSPFRATPASAFGPAPTSEYMYMASSAPVFATASTFGSTQAPSFDAPQPPASGVASSSGGFRGCSFGPTQASPYSAPQSPFTAASSGGFSLRPAQGSSFDAISARTAQTVASTSLFGSCVHTSQASPFGGGFGEPQPEAGAVFGASLFGSTPASQTSPYGGGFGAASSHQQQVLRADDQTATSASDPHTRLRSLLQHQSFDGLFPLVPAIAALFNTSIDNLKTKLGELRKQSTGLMELAEIQWEVIWATCLAVEFMKSELKELRDEWELVVEKAERRVESLLKNSELLARFTAAAKTS